MSGPDEEGSLARIYVLAGAAIFIAMIACITVVVSEGQGDALTRTVIALAPFISGGITLIGTGFGHKLLQKNQQKTRVDVAQTKTEVTELKQEAAPDVLSKRLENVTRQVLQDPAIQQKIADKLGDTLINKASQAGIVRVPPKGADSGSS